MYMILFLQAVRKYHEHLQIRFLNFDTSKLGKFCCDILDGLIPLTVFTESVQSSSGSEVKTAALEDTEEILDQG